MARAFVIRIPDEVDLTGGQFAGRIEEVETGRECRFTSVERFLEFIQLTGSAEGAKGERDVNV
jgi:hypothetical protein